MTAMAQVMEFWLLGPLLVRCGGTAVPLPRGHQRAVLAALLLGANQVVTVDELAEVLWGQDLPASARVTVQNYVKRLRIALGRAGRDRIVTRPRGYLIRVDAGELDVPRFEVQVASARSAARDGSWEQAGADADAALALWRGEPLADVDSPALALREVPRLAELHLQALEVRLEADLHLGRHADAVPELQRLTGRHPLREHLSALLMLGLYQSGRQGDALATYATARQALADELAAEPGSELRELHQRILAADSSLTARRPELSGADPAPAAVPRQLPGATAHFAGRADELTTLSRLLDEIGSRTPGTVVISAVGGTAGVGKTALAVHWAHQVAHRFPDGQLYVNLRGYDPSGIPLTPSEAARGFLTALGVPPGRLPPDLATQAGLYRSLVAGRRLLIVLDNARNVDQVRSLLPGSRGSMVLVTSRVSLAGLAASDGAHLLTLNVLTVGEARELLVGRLGQQRADAEPHAVDELIGLCGRLPLALAIAAARAADRPVFSLAALAAELREAGRRLDVLSTGEASSDLRAVFSWSCRQLVPSPARMFRMLGLHPGPDITTPAAASLTGTPFSQACRDLAELARAHLVTEHAPGRYTLHDLLRAYAAEQGRHSDCDADRREATGRILDHYLHTAARAALLLNPAKEPVVLDPPRPGAAAGQIADSEQALAWFEAEHQVLISTVSLAAQAGFDAHAWQLPWAMMPFLQVRGHWQEWAAAQRTALAAATRLGNAAAQALSGRLLAIACSNLGDHDQAQGHYASSLMLCQRLGDRLGQAKIHQSLCVLAERQRRYADALGHAEQALRLYQEIGDKTPQAETLNNVGWCHGLLGDYRQARAFCRQAVTLSTEAGHRWAEGNAWAGVGYAEHHLGNLAEAAACYERALSLLRDSGVRFDEADTLSHLGDTRYAAGELARAREAWQQALTILEDLHHPDAEQVRAKL
jgi:DNA-binding SARP family transcriptional activator/tetratricopeptide (TPR) repeat protein